MKQSLTALLYDELKAQRIMSYEEVEDLAERNGYKPETATRRLRFDFKSPHLCIPCVKLNAKKKKIIESERWYFVKWAGSKV